MTWDALFEDLTSGLESEWEYERAARDAEQQRLRIARTTRHERLAAFAAEHQTVALTLSDRRTLAGELVGLGADWFALRGDPLHALHLVPEHAIVAVGVAPESARVNVGTVTGAQSDAAPNLAARMTLGFVARDLARRRLPVTVHVATGAPHHGTIDRAGADHLDLAVHPLEVPRRSHAVQSVQLIAFAHIASVSVEPHALTHISG